MVWLKKAKDGHFYILAGMSLGTGQVDPRGQQWLQFNHYQLPDQWDSTFIDAGTYRYLKDKGYLYIKHEFYASNQIQEQPGYKAKCGRVNP